MERYCHEVPGPKLANCLENGLFHPLLKFHLHVLKHGILQQRTKMNITGLTPMLPPKRLGELGFTIAAYPLSLLAVCNFYSVEL